MDWIRETFEAANPEDFALLFAIGVIVGWGIFFLLFVERRPPHGR